MSHQKWSGRTASLVASVLALGLLAACGGGTVTDTQNPKARADIQVMVSQSLSAADVARVRVEVRGPGIDVPLGTDLVKDGSTWQGSIGDIPAGADRVFEATATDAAGKAIYRGASAPTAIAAGGTVSVTILLQQVEPEVPYENTAPVIDALVVSANLVQPGGSITLTAAAHDDNPGDTLSYSWTARAGSFSPANAPATTWTAPAVEGAQRLQLEVKDSKGASAIISVDVAVQRGSATTGSATVTVGFNTWPRVEAMTGAPSVVALNGVTQLAATVVDPDGDAPRALWTSSCVGNFGDAAVLTPSFTLRALPASGVCAFRVEVSDGRGGQHSGSLVLHTGTPPAANVVPQFVGWTQSATEASGGEVVTLRVSAVDPEGTPVTYDWLASQSGYRTRTDTDGSTEVQWVAPACFSDASVTLTAIARDATGAEARKLFTVAARPGWQCDARTVRGVRTMHYVLTDGIELSTAGDLSNLSIDAWVPTADGSGYVHRPGVGLADGTFAIPNVDSVPFLLKVGPTSYHWFNTRWVDLSRAQLGRPDVEFEPQGTQLALQLEGLAPWQGGDDIQLYAANANLNYFSLGCTRPYSQPAEGSTLLAATVDYTASLANCGNTAVKVDPARGDQLIATQLVTRVAPDGIEYQEVRRALRAPGFERQADGALRLAGTLLPEPTTALSVQLRAADFEALAVAGHPRAVLRQDQLNIGASPGYTFYGTFSGWPDLAFAYVRTPGQALVSPVVEFANPYGSAPLFAHLTTTAAVRFTLGLPDGGTTSRNFNVAASAQEPLVAGMVLEPRVGPPQDLRVNGLPAAEALQGTGETPLLSWTPHSLGSPTLYVVRVYRLSVDAGNVVQRASLASLSTPATQLRLPPGLLAMGQTYYFQVTAFYEPELDPARPFMSVPRSYSAASATGTVQP